MIVYRLSKGKFRNDLSGKGAELAGGRWNSKGTAMVYTSQSRALCTTEIAVHTPLGIMPEDYFLISISVPDKSSIIEIAVKDLEPAWRKFPHPHFTQQLGDAFVQDNKFLVLKVPSAVVPGDFNFLLNPAHSDFKKVKISASEPFEFDERLFIK